MVQDTRRGGKNYIAKTTSREKQVDPRLNLTVLHVEAGRDNTRFVKTTVELDHNLSRAMVIDNSEFTNVTCQQLIRNQYRQSKQKESMLSLW